MQSENSENSEISQDIGRSRPKEGRPRPNGSRGEKQRPNRSCGKEQRPNKSLSRSGSLGRMEEDLVLGRLRPIEGSLDRLRPKRNILGRLRPSGYAEGGSSRPKKSREERPNEITQKEANMGREGPNTSSKSLQRPYAESELKLGREEIGRMKNAWVK